jgi:predicted NAD/FAD-dependent oxidoreductase
MASRAVVIAVPSWKLGAILEGSGEASIVSDAATFRPSPIVTVFLRLRRPILNVPLAGLVGGRFHWLFDRSGIEPGPPPGQWSYAAVASAARQIVDLPSRQIVDIALGEIASRIRGADRSLLAGARVVKHRRATFSPAPGSGSVRPCTGEASLGNLALAGDWTDTGLPATLEGAVLSGRRAAERLLCSTEAVRSVRYRMDRCRTARTTTER